jgi:hypothetical protein
VCFGNSFPTILDHALCFTTLFHYYLFHYPKLLAGGLFELSLLAEFAGVDKVGWLAWAGRFKILKLAYFYYGSLVGPSGATLPSYGSTGLDIMQQ